MERYTISIANTNFLTVAVLSLAIFALLTIHNPSFGVGNANFTTLNLTNTTMASQTPQPGEGTTNFTNPMLADPDRINMTNTTGTESGMHSTMNTMTNQSSTTAANDLPIPSGERIFTPDKANIMKVLNDPLVVELVQTPKVVAAGQPVTFVMNLYHKNGSWLWHSDFDVSVTNAKTGEKLLSMPNIHGHGSMAQYSYVFPSAGTYTVSVTYGQQVNSPNYIQPHDVRKAEFAVNVVDSENTTAKQESTGTTTASTTTQAPVKDVYVEVVSWGFTPNKIEVDQGDLVRLHFTTANDEVSLYNGHGFGIEGYNVNTFLVKGTDQTVEFIADKPGTFTFRCTSFCSLPDAPESAHFNMVGQFIVNQKANQ